MSICVKKKFLFPYLMIATTISSIEQPQLVSLVQENKTNFNATNAHNGHDTPDSLINNSETSSFKMIDTNIITYKFNKLNNQYLSPLITISDLSSKSLNYQLKNDKLQSNKITKINYQILNQSIIEKKQNHFAEITKNSKTSGYSYSILLLLLSLGIIGSFAFFVYYKNQKNIKQKNEYLFKILRFDKNSRNLSFWKNEISNNFQSYLILNIQNIIFYNYLKFKKVMVNFNVISLNQYTPS